MGMGSGVVWVGAVAVAIVCAGPPARAEEPAGAVEEILQILQDRGLIDEVTHASLLAKHRAAQASPPPGVGAALTDGWQWSGDLRLRHEVFAYRHDGLGSERDNRYRFRYRGRIGFEKKINDWLAVGMRLASGADDPTSTNQTLGSGNDFDTDDIRFDLAYAEMTRSLGGGVEARLLAGKTSNPFVWKVGRDSLVFDNDITLEGATLSFFGRPTETLKLFVHAGGFIDDENSGSKDPKLLGLQAGGSYRPDEHWELGLRASGYFWRSLDSAFQTRATCSNTDPNRMPGDCGRNAGNLANAFDPEAHIGETSAYLTWKGIADWPVTLYGMFAHNFSADDATLTSTLVAFPGTTAVDEEDDAWMIGLELGDKKRWVQLGLAWARVEANSLVSLTTDSDWFDGRTNREGWALYGTRQLAPNIDLGVTLFRTDHIENDRAVFADSVADAERLRLQTDLNFKF